MTSSVKSNTPDMERTTCKRNTGTDVCFSEKEKRIEKKPKKKLKEKEKL